MMKIRVNIKCGENENKKINKTMKLKEGERVKVYKSETCWDKTNQV